MSDLVARLKAACVGHPDAKIPWPHRLLHEAADELTSLRARVAELKAALRQIAAYGDDGICPYGCDTPNIATKALAGKQPQEGG